MKPSSAFFVSLVILTSCSSPNPDACTCGQELSKSQAEQDTELMNACAQKGDALPDKQKPKWFEDVMNCVE
ncbi:MAG: hypothetical protein FJ349_05905 [Sphingomonadales bacterium]|nr:hypothetical protein [Sphingomonadales bacterium]